MSFPLEIWKNRIKKGIEIICRTRTRRCYVHWGYRLIFFSKNKSSELDILFSESNANYNLIESRNNARWKRLTFPGTSYRFCWGKWCRSPPDSWYLLQIKLPFIYEPRGLVKLVIILRLVFEKSYDSELFFDSIRKLSLDIILDQIFAL